MALGKLQENSQSVRLLFYFKRSTEDPFTLDVDQLQKVKRFRRALADNGVVYRDFAETSEFVQQTRDHLYNLIIDEWKDGSWLRIDGLGQPSGPKEPTGGAADAGGEGSKSKRPTEDEPTASPVATAEGSVDEVEPGFLEYLEKFHEAVPAVVETFEKMSGHTTRMNERIRARTAESESIQDEQRRLKGVGGSRLQQEQVGRAKDVVNGAANDLDEYAESMGAALGQYRTHSRAMLNSFRLAVVAGGELWTNESKNENRTAIKTMIEAMTATLQHITEFQATIKRIPALTGRFRQARNRTAAVLGELIAEITFSIGEADQIVTELGDTGQHVSGRGDR